MDSLLLPEKRAPNCLHAEGRLIWADLVEKQAALQGQGHQAHTSVSSGLLVAVRNEGTLEARGLLERLAQRNSTNPWCRRDLPRASQSGSLLLGPGSSSAWSARKASLQGCVGHVLGYWTWREAAYEALASPGGLLLFPLHEGSK